MKIRRGVGIGAGALVCLTMLATRAAGAAPARSTDEPPPEIPRMVVFELFAPPASAG
jgi:hypothetical protein